MNLLILCLMCLPTGDPVNTTCPISGDALDGSTTLEWNDHVIGFCCPGCPRQFTAWDDERKAAYVAAEKPEKVASDPYWLDTCPVSGAALGSMGDPVVREYDGREVRFCCGGCIARFEADQEKYWAEIDETMIEAQLPYYPLQECIVMSDEALVEDEAVNLIYGNRLVRFCCRMCIRQFNEDPAAYLETIDEGIAEGQRDAYPLDTCVIAGGELGSMGEPYEIIVGSRLVRLCCAGCEGKVLENPAQILATIDEAWDEAGGVPAGVDTDGDDGG